MNVKVEKTKNNNEVKLEITVEAEKFESGIKSVFNKNAKYFNIPGFRKGKAPFHIVEKTYGSQIFYEDAFNELVPEIYDAWERGCRTIYAVRLSGKDMYKDYELAIESDLMLRVSGQFPCNDNKDCFMLYKAQQGSAGAGFIRLYKPATRTTVQEKLQGVVNNVNSILVTEFNLDANGITKGTRLVDLINKINSLDSNNFEYIGN